MDTKPADLRYATDLERRYALAYLRYLAGRRRTMAVAEHHAINLSPERGRQIRDDIDQMVRDASL